MRKILFLDIDGVLNNRESSCWSLSGETMFQMHPDCVARLRTLVESEQIMLVLSSTWRLAFNQGCAIAIDTLAAKGWPGVAFLGHTPTSPRRRCRGLECEAWIDEHGQAGDIYVAVDDDNDFEGFRGVLVLTNGVPGLTDEGVEMIRAAFQ